MKFTIDSYRSATLFAAGTLLSTLAALPAAATVVTFDDLSDPQGQGTAIASPYAGFNWDNFDVLNVAAFDSIVPGSGYGKALVSGPNVGFNAYGDPAAVSAQSAFSLVDGTFASAFWGTLQVTATGFLAGSPVVTQTFSLGQTAGSHVSFDAGFQNVDKVTFSAIGAPPGPSGYAGTQFAVDNLNLVSSVPEPSSLALVLAGVLTLGGSASLRRRRLR